MEPSYPSEYKEEGMDQMLEVGSKTANLASFVLVSKLVVFVLSGATLIVIARILGPAEYGVYILALSVSGATGLFSDFGVTNALLRFIPEYLQKKQFQKINSLLANSAAFILAEGLFFTLMTVAFAGPLAQFVLHDAAYTHLIQIAAFTILTSIFYGTGTYVLIAFGKGKLLSVATAIGMVVQSAFSIGLALMGLGAAAPLIGFVLGMAASSLMCMYFILKQQGIRFEPKRISLAQWKPLLRFSLPVGLSTTFTTVAGNISIIFLGLYVASSVVGGIGLTSRIATIFDLVLGSIGISLLPVYSVTLSNGKNKAKQRKEVNRYYNRSLYFALLFAAPLIFYTIILAQPVVFTIFGGSYAAAVPFVFIMGIGVLLGLAGIYTSSLMVGAGLVKKVMKYNVALTALQLVLLPVAVTMFAGMGLAFLIFLLIPSLTSLVFVIGAVGEFKIRIEALKISKVIAASVISALFILPLALLLNGAFVALLASAFVEQLLLYPAVAGVIGAVNKEEATAIREITKSIPIVGSVMRLLTGYTSLFLR